MPRPSPGWRGSRRDEGKTLGLIPSSHTLTSQDGRLLGRRHPQALGGSGLAPWGQLLLLHSAERRWGWARAVSRATGQGFGGMAPLPALPRGWRSSPPRSVQSPKGQIALPRPLTQRVGDEPRLSRLRALNPHPASWGPWRGAAPWRWGPRGPWRALSTGRAAAPTFPVGAEVMGPRGFNQGFLTPAFTRVQEEGKLGTTHGLERPGAQVPAPLPL